jgi:hypothetical protein
MKHEWRKKEKSIYLPKSKPEFIDVPEFQFLTIEGEGNPNSDMFSEYIGALYALSYAIKMNSKNQTVKPDGYYDYTVYPLEGVWDINDEAKKTFDGALNKDDLVFRLMIRQPDFLNEKLFQEMLELSKKKKDNKLFDQVRLETIAEGKCVQMLHVGSYDNEPVSFKIMEEFAEHSGYVRKSKIHREIYLSDFRKVPVEKLKTVLRFQV